MFKKIFINLCLLCALCTPLSISAQTCVPGNVTGCPQTTLSSSGDVTGTVPLIHCIVSASYSSQGNSAARVWDVCYNKSLSLSDKTQPICVIIHGGGDSAGDQHGDFGITGGSGGTVAQFMFPIETGVCGTVISPNYTMYSGGLGTNAVYPAPVPDILCALHSIAHAAGTTFPGNPNDIRMSAFSWGTHLALLAAWNPTGYTASCEYSDSYTINMLALISPLVDIMPQFDSGQDSTFMTGIKGAFNCTDHSTCTTNTALYNPRSFFTASSTRTLFITGSTDTTTNPTYQMDPLVSNSNISEIKVSAVGHGADKNSLFTGISVPAVLTYLRDTAPSGSSGGSTVAGGAF